MADLRNVAVLSAAFAVAFAGCSKDDGSESAQSTGTEGAEQTTTTSVEEWRAEEELPEDQRVVDQGVDRQPTMVDPDMQQQTGAKSPMMLTDGEIAKITDVVHQGEIEQAQLARTKASHSDVKEYAAKMIEEHTETRQEGSQLVRKQQLVTQDSATATELSSSANQTMQSLRTAQGREFDRQYIRSQVEQHQKVLDMLDKQLIAAADDGELKEHLQEARDMVEDHLEEAREIQQKLAQQQ